MRALRAVQRSEVGSVGAAAPRRMVGPMRDLQTDDELFQALECAAE
jgi:hypothetical protein